MGYAASLQQKEAVLAELFPEDTAKMQPAIAAPSSQQSGSRNKAKLAVAEVLGQHQFGFYDALQAFKALEDCPLHAAPINALLLVLKRLLGDARISPYDLKSRSGELKFVIITYSETTNELLLRFVLRSKAALIQLQSLTQKLIEIEPRVKVVTANIQGKHQAILEGDEELVLTTRETIAHQFGEVTLLQGPRSFFQTNSGMAHALYHHFQTALRLTPVKTLLDLYCGVGAFSFFAMPHCERVVGVELSPAAIHCAKQAIGMNTEKNIEFIARDAEVYLQTAHPHQFDGVVVNPPRRGLNEAVIGDIIRLSPDYIFYSSCNATTLKRDCEQLEPHYQRVSLQLFDMFPYTSHFETLVVLVKASL